MRARACGSACGDIIDGKRQGDVVGQVDALDAAGAIRPVRAKLSRKLRKFGPGRMDARAASRGDRARLRT